MTAVMQLKSTGIQQQSSDLQQISTLLPMEHATVLELGCGAAGTTRKLAEKFPQATIIATEVDEIAHAKNLTISDLPNVTFQAGGAQQIEAEDNSVDVVIMLKSLHHVPMALLEQALIEICRVLKPGGLAYFSEPVFEGDFNDIMRIFHDEEVVRQQAFAALGCAVAEGTFELVDEIFFSSSRRFQGFEEFESRMLGVTHTDHQLSESIYQQVKAKFSAYLDANGKVEFFTPNRIDLLRKPL